ncbi:hypothetical protein CY34DRAFT_807915 [Suillus luteus UH-Slu-Lm8-n1]|uniref:Uncharacterized protein n=1 Tax=Suillus luteus UH-Slu-Lm8-n1 TaxID=930992 RepID=A0A0D0B7E2_9AGAM|nr:hypothetical protein CY34DRAFT_807915 [Suillus luteus UH-Slu-Lm8-n1]
MRSQGLAVLNVGPHQTLVSASTELNSTYRGSDVPSKRALECSTGARTKYQGTCLTPTMRSIHDNYIGLSNGWKFTTCLIPNITGT